VKAFTDSVAVPKPKAVGAVLVAPKLKVVAVTGSANVEPEVITKESKLLFASKVFSEKLVSEIILELRTSPKINPHVAIYSTLLAYLLLPRG